MGLHDRSSVTEDMSTWDATRVDLGLLGDGHGSSVGGDSQLPVSTLRRLSGPLYCLAGLSWTGWTRIRTLAYETGWAWTRRAVASILPG